MINFKKGAVFGADARIAIVIFSILGAMGAYYTGDIISKTQSESVIEQVKTLRQAAKQNIADNGYDYTLADTVLNDNLFGIYEGSSSADLGRGRNNYAYINQTNPSATVGITLINTSERIIEVVNNNMFSSDASTGASSKTTDCADTLDKCYYWFKMNNVDAASFKTLDTYYDGSAGLFTDTPSIEEGIVVAPSVNIGSDTAVVLIKIGER